MAIKGGGGLFIGAAILVCFFCMSAVKSDKPYRVEIIVIHSSDSSNACVFF